MIYEAAAAYPYEDRERATSGLRDQLRLMAITGGGNLDWTSLTVEGPTEAPGPHGATWLANGGRPSPWSADGTSSVSPSTTRARPSELRTRQPWRRSLSSSRRVVPDPPRTTGKPAPAVASRLEPWRSDGRVPRVGTCPSDRSAPDPPVTRFFYEPNSPRSTRGEPPSQTRDGPAAQCTFSLKRCEEREGLRLPGQLQVHVNRKLGGAAALSTVAAMTRCESMRRVPRSASWRCVRVTVTTVTELPLWQPLSPAVVEPGGAQRVLSGG